jgi:hypothetical protein
MLWTLPRNTYTSYPEIQGLTLDLDSSLRHLYFNIQLLEKERPKPEMEISEFIVSLILEATLPYLYC